MTICQQYCNAYALLNDVSTSIHSSKVYIATLRAITTTSAIDLVMIAEPLKAGYASGSTCGVTWVIIYRISKKGINTSQLS